MVTLGSDDTIRAIRTGKIDGICPRFTEVGGATEYGVVAVVGRTLAFHLLGAAAEDDVDGIALKRYLWMIVVLVAVGTLHIVQTAP